MKPTVSLLLLLVLLAAQPACFLKFWGGSDSDDAEAQAKPKIYDVYGTVESVSADSLVIQTKKGKQSFRFGPASIKGSDFGAGAYVHVYFKQVEQVKEVTMVVEKID